MRQLLDTQGPCLAAWFDHAYLYALTVAEVKKKVALAVLAERRRLAPETFPGFSLTTFEGTPITI